MFVGTAYALSWIASLSTITFVNQLCEIPFKRKFEDDLLIKFQKQWELNKNR